MNQWKIIDLLFSGLAEQIMCLEYANNVNFNFGKKISLMLGKNDNEHYEGDRGYEFYSNVYLIKSELNGFEDFLQI